MPDRKHFLQNLWRWSCGLSELEESKPKMIDIDELRKSEWCEEFEQLMRNRLIMGAIRYGKLNEQDKPTYERAKTMAKKVALYVETKNKEVLVDLANYAMIEYIEPSEEGTYFAATDDMNHDTIKK